MLHNLTEATIDAGGWVLIVAASLVVAIVAGHILRYAILCIIGVLMRLGVID